MRKYIKAVFFMLIFLISISSFSFNLILAADLPTVNSPYAVLIDAKTGQILYNKNMHQTSYPASITKIMTAILAIEKGGFDNVFTADLDTISIEPGSSHIAIKLGEQLTIEQLLYGLMLESGNDAANALAQYVSSSIPDFSELMTEKAKELGALNTSFKNAHGLHDENHYTTAYDMAMIMKYAITLPKFKEIISTYKYQVPPTNKVDETRYWRNSNKLLSDMEYEYCVGGKTGWTTPAGNTLVIYAQKDGRDLISVILKGNNRVEVYNDTVNLLEYGFNNFKEYVVPKDTIEIAPVKVLDDGEVVGEIDCFAATDYTFLIPNHVNEEDVIIDYDIPDEIDEDSGLTAKIKFSLPDSLVSKRGHKELLTISLVPGAINYYEDEGVEVSAEENDTVESESNISSFFSNIKLNIFQKVCFTLAGILLFLFIIALMIRAYNLRRRRNRIRYRRGYIKKY